ncbi:MAG: hypothetical protein GY875_15830 [Gammaproteobacteria bacterium]|nr:hypothetical protein [Gammaproteobacteria bacterium]
MEFLKPAHIGLAKFTGVLFTAVFILLNTSTVQAVPLPCGTTLTTDTTLDSDMDCSTFDGTAINFEGANSNDVTLDCAGHVISAGTESAIIARNVSGVTIRNCTISTSSIFSHGVSLLNGVSNSLVTGNTILTTGDFTRGIEVRQSSANEISDNDISTTGQSSVPLQMRSASNNNRVVNNRLLAVNATTINIQSSSGNEVIENTLIAPWNFVIQHNLLMQGGGIAIDNGDNIYAVENDWGSSGVGIGTLTAFAQINKETGALNSVVPLSIGGSNIDFGFNSLEVLPNGRILALPDFGTGTALYEIDPNLGTVTVTALNLPALSGKPNGLEAISDTILLATTSAGELLNIDLTTNNVTVLPEQAKGWTDLAINPQNGKAYAVSHPEDEASGSNHLYEINVSNGEVIVEIGSLGRRFISDIDFALDGTLYANNGGGLNIIDPATGSYIHVGSFGPNPLEPFTPNTRLESNLLLASQGSIEFTDPITLPTELQTSISREHIKVNFNEVKVDSAALPFLDSPARITLTGLAGNKRSLLVDENSDGTFDACPPARCTLVSFLGGTLIFDVTGFTTYSSEKTDDGGTVEGDESEGGGSSSSGSAASLWLLLLLSIIATLQRLHFRG